MLRFVFISCVLAACGSNNNMAAEHFDTFQACYDEHHGEEMLDTQCAIEICCIDHPIGSSKMNVVCGADATSCSTYVTGNLTDSADTMLSTDITTACQHYVVDGQGGSGSGGMCSG